MQRVISSVLYAMLVALLMLSVSSILRVDAMHLLDQSLKAALNPSNAR